MPNVGPLHIFAVMPSGLEYHQREIDLCEKWWFDLVATGRWWMATMVYPKNVVTHRVRAAVGPYSGQLDLDGHPVVHFAIIAFGSTEIEAKIHVMRQVTKITTL